MTTTELIRNVAEASACGLGYHLNINEAEQHGIKSEYYKDYLHAYLIACGFYEHDNADIEEVEDIVRGRAE